jgi:F-type H+-transporting ATPase subunit delta
VRNLVIAKRYAKALFNLAKDEGQVDQYGQELDGFVQLLGSLPDLANAIQNPLYPEGTRKAVFNSIGDKAGLTPIMKSFVNLLITKNRVGSLSEIQEYYNRLIDENANIARADLSAAVELDEQTIGDIACTLEKMTGKKVVVHFQQDPSLIGGLVARIGDLVLDGSIRSQLLGIKESLKRGELG